MSTSVWWLVQDSVVGRCEALYEVIPLPKTMAFLRPNSRLCDKQQMYEILKVRNYSNCQLLSEDHAHLPIRDCTPGGANCGDFWTVGLLNSKKIYFLRWIASFRTDVIHEEILQCLIRAELKISSLTQMTGCA